MKNQIIVSPSSLQSASPGIKTSKNSSISSKTHPQNKLSALLPSRPVSFLTSVGRNVLSESSMCWVRVHDLVCAPSWEMSPRLLHQHLSEFRRHTNHPDHWEYNIPWRNTVNQYARVFSASTWEYSNQAVSELSNQLLFLLYPAGEFLHFPFLECMERQVLAGDDLRLMRELRSDVGAS